MSVNALNDSMKMALGKKTLKGMAKQAPGNSNDSASSSLTQANTAIGSAGLNVVELKQPYILRVENNEVSLFFSSRNI